MACNLLWSGNGVLEFVVDKLTDPVGRMWLRMLIMVVVPLVFASVTLGVAGLGNLKKLGRMGIKTVAFFLMSSALAAAIGLVLVNWLRPGAGVPPGVRDRLVGTYQSEATRSMELAGGAGFGTEMLVNIVPRNPIGAMAQGDMLGVIFFSLIFGMGLGLLPKEKSATMLGFLRGLEDTVTMIIGMVMKLAPYGVFCLIFTITARFGFDLLAKLGWYVVAVMAGLAFQQVVVYPILVRILARLNPLAFLRAIKKVMLTAFTTSSSSATLPTTMREAEQRLGVPREVSRFVLPLGATMNMNGAAVFVAMTVLFIAQVFGVELSLASQMIVIVMAVVSAVGAAGVPSGVIPLLILVLETAGVPGEGVA
ncbi:MAG: dicarboxylate/amino acid:cation symporter, partial [Acidobacteria bacterium]|nr:dicarboxylate/amino acid:cation symporter [Acidobacteriota bacterium]